MTDISAQTTVNTVNAVANTSMQPGDSTDQATAGSLNPEGYDALKAEAAAETGAEEQSRLQVRDQSFRVVSNLPGIVLLDLGVASDPSATQGEQLRALREFLKAAIHPDDLPRFEHFLRTAQPTIYIEELNGIVEKLLTVIGGRPTK